LQSNVVLAKHIRKFLRNQDKFGTNCAIDNTPNISRNSYIGRYSKDQLSADNNWSVSN